MNHQRTAFLFMAVFAVSWAWGASHAQDARPAKTTTAESAPPAQTSSAPVDPNARRAAMEREFADLLTGVTLRGMWQMTGEGGLSGKEPLTEPKSEAYHIVSAAKLSDDYWLISARIEVDEKNVTVPVPVRVEWAGDTPVITLDDIPIPTMGTYSARVMFFRGFYSGTWLSNTKNYGGILAGRMVREDPTSAPVKPAAEEPADSKPSTEKTPSARQP